MQTPKPHHESQHKPQFHDDIFEYCRLWQIYEPYSDSDFVSDEDRSILSKDSDTVTAYLKAPASQSQEIRNDILAKVQHLVRVIHNILETHTYLSKNQREKDTRDCDRILKHWKTSVHDICTKTQKNIKKSISNTLERTAHASQLTTSEDIQHENIPGPLPKELAFLSNSTKKFAQTYLLFWESHLSPMLQHISPAVQKNIQRHYEFAKKMQTGIYEENAKCKRSLCFNIFFLLDTIKNMLDVPDDTQKSQVFDYISTHHALWNERKKALQNYHAEERKVAREQQNRAIYLWLNPSSGEMVQITEEQTTGERARLQKLYPHAQLVK